MEDYEKICIKQLNEKSDHELWRNNIEDKAFLGRLRPFLRTK